MAQSITNNFPIELLKATAEKFQSASDSFYVFYARPLEYDIPGNPDNIVKTNIEENSIKSKILAMKKIVSSDVAYGFIKNTWTSGTVYSQYQDNEEASENNCWVYNENTGEVFKCLDNNNSDSYGSTITPEDTGERLSDGYLWKKLFTIPNAYLKKFQFQNLLPIFLDSNNIEQTTPGTVDRIDIENGGSDYDLFENGTTELDYLPLFIKGNGKENTSATVNISTVDGSGSITGYSISGPTGNGYTVDLENRKIPVQIRQLSSERTVESSGNEFVHAYGIAEVDENQAIIDLEIISSGEDYSTGLAQIVQSSVVAYAEHTSGVIDDILYVSNGSDYTIAEAVIISSNGSGASLSPVVSPPLGHGSNPINELNTNELLINVKISYDEESDFSVLADFRTLGIISDVKSNGFAATANTLSGKEIIEVDDTYSAIPDDIVFGEESGAKGIVVDVINNKFVRIIRPEGISNKKDFFIGEKLISASSTEEIKKITKPEYDSYTGNIIYINNTNAIQRSEDQIESINFKISV